MNQIPNDMTEKVSFDENPMCDGCDGCDGLTPEEYAAYEQEYNELAAERSAAVRDFQIEVLGPEVEYL